MDKIGSRSSGAARAGTGPTMNELNQASAEILVACLKKRYGLADPNLGSRGERDRSESSIAIEDSGRSGGGSRNLTATVLWLLVGLGYVAYARLQKGLAPLLGGLAIFFLAVTGVLPWIWTSICCLMVVAVVFALSRWEGANF